MTYSVTNIFHSTQLVRDLEQARTWFQRVFRRRTLSWADRWDLSTIAPDYPVDYSFMVQIGDLVHDALCPTLYRPPNSDSVLWDDVNEGLAGISWWLKDSCGFSQAMADHHIRLRDQSGNAVPGGAFSPTLIVPNFSLMTTEAEDAGFAHSFSEMLPPTLERYETALPRLSPAWQQPPVAPDDPLQIDRVAWHTLTTSNLRRSLHYMTEVLNGRVVHRAMDADGHERVYVFFADTILEYMHRPEDGGFDQYRQISFRTTDLARARQHLAACGVRVSADGPGRIATEAADSLGSSWGFVADYVPGDPRI